MSLDALADVTRDYSLVLIDNGFDDQELIEELKPETYIRNDENVGVLKAINQGLDACCDATYIAVMHSDCLILDDGWLDHIIEFMDKRQDVGVVALCGRQSVDKDGRLDDDSTVYNQQEYFDHCKPSWRFTEVAVIDGVCFVFRNIGLRMDETLGIMHYYDMDFSMQYAEAGYRSYVAGIDCKHLAGFGWDSSTTSPDYLTVVGGSDAVYYEEVRERFKRKWQHMLPITRGYTDEYYFYHRLEGMKKTLDEHDEHVKEMATHYDSALEQIRLQKAEMARASEHIERVNEEFERLQAHVAAQQQLIETLSNTPSASNGHENGSIHEGMARKLAYYIAKDGVGPTTARTGAYIKRKMKSG